MLEIYVNVMVLGWTYLPKYSLSTFGGLARSVLICWKNADTVIP